MLFLKFSLDLKAVRRRRFDFVGQLWLNARVAA